MYIKEIIEIERLVTTIDASGLAIKKLTKKKYFSIKNITGYKIDTKKSYILFLFRNHIKKLS